jgi:hypothetical protein
MLLVLPIDSANAARHYVVLVRLIPLQDVALLLAEFSKIAWHEMGIAT